MIFKNDNLPRFKDIEGECFELESWQRDKEALEEEGEHKTNNFLTDIDEYEVVEEQGCYGLYVR